MKRPRIYPVALLAFVVCTPVFAQFKDQAEPQFEQIVIPLKYAASDDLANIVQQFIREGRVGFDRRTNAIVISAPSADIQVARRLVETLDVTSELADPITVKTYQLDADMVSPRLPDLLQPFLQRSSKIAFDPQSAMLVVSATVGEQKEVAQFLHDLQAHAANNPNGSSAGKSKRSTGAPLSVSFYFIQAMMGPENQLQMQMPASETRTADPRDEAVQSKLQKPIRVNFDNATFETAIEQLAEKGQVDILVDWPEVEALGFGSDTVFSLALREPVPLRQALQLVLDHVADLGEIEFAVRDGIVRITSSERIRRDTYTQVYDVLELVKAVPRFAIDSGSSQAISPSKSNPSTKHGFKGGNDATAQFSGGSENGNSPQDGSRSIPPVLWQERDDEPADELVDLIRASITPDDWASNGGSIASVYHLTGMLVVKHNARGHAEIAKLLDELRDRHATTRARVSRMEPPALLDPVMGTLAEMGYRSAMLLAPLNVTVGLDEAYQLEGCAAQFDRMLGVRVRGGAKRIDDASVELEVRAEIGPKVALPGTLGNPEPMFRLSSTLRVPMNDYVVLAASPGATDYGQAIMLVVRVTEAK